MLCKEGEETVEHLLRSCIVAAKVWQNLSLWTKVNRFFFFNVSDLLELHEHVAVGGKNKEALKGLIMVTSWCIWKARNEARFSNIEVNVEGIMQSIKTLGFLWYKIGLRIKRSSGKNGVSSN